MARPRKPILRRLVPMAALAISGLLLILLALRPEFWKAGAPSSGGLPILQSELVGQMAPSLDAGGAPAPQGIAPWADTGFAVVNFWASWCPPCRAEHPTLLKLAAAGVPIIGVDLQDSTKNARQYLDELGNPFASVVFDTTGAVSTRWGVAAPPQTFIVDAEGRITAHFAGAMVGSDFEQRFLPALAAAGWDGKITR